MSSAKSPLLANYLVPLAPEKPCAEKAAPELFVPVEVRCDTLPRQTVYNNCRTFNCMSCACRGRDALQVAWMAPALGVICQINRV